MKPKHTPLGRVVAATRYSIDGLITTFRCEAAFRQELVLYLLFLPLIVFLPLAVATKMVLFLANTLVSSDKTEMVERKATYVFKKHPTEGWRCVIDNSYGHDLISAEAQ